MTIDEILAKLDGVTCTSHSKGQYSARCPAHDDRQASLSISSGERGEILLYCHAGCDTESVLSALGLKKSDLFNDKQPKQKRAARKIVARYNYLDADGILLNQKTRWIDENGKKSFTWSHKEGGKWVSGKQGADTLYNLPVVRNYSDIYIAEGEKDVETLSDMGLAAVCGAHGAGKDKWVPEYTEALRGKNVAVLQDNDKTGKAFAVETCNALSGVAARIKLIDLTRQWPTLPEHGDISDIAATEDKQSVYLKLMQLVKDTEEYRAQSLPVQIGDSFLSCFKTLEEFEEQEASWLVQGWIPEGQITLIAADGGIGKTTLWCNIIAAVSSGKTCILDPDGYTRQPALVAFLTTEDSVRKKLKKKLRLAGANERNIITPDFLSDKEDILHNMKFGTEDMKRFIQHFKPALCVYDPVQGFIPPDINMGSRNAMRDCMAPLISLGEDCKTTFLVICHTNKRKGASGRDRIADSADLWDISRSVIMAGYTEDQGVRYISNEKNNYDQLQKTILFTIGENGIIQPCGTTWKRNREYMQENMNATSKPMREECKEFILHTLEEAGGSIKTKELEKLAEESGYSCRTLRRAKDELKDDGEIKYVQVGHEKSKEWYTYFSRDRQTHQSGQQTL